MRKLAFIFPGQGSQVVGMGKLLYQKYESIKKLFKKADEVLGFSLKNMCFNGPENELCKTYNTQPAILTVSIACYLSLVENGVKPDIVAGHSLGEYSALVVAEAIDFSDAVKLVRKRGEFMQDAVPIGQGSMAAILGLNRDSIIKICDKLNTEIEPIQAVNFNCPGQTVIAGSTNKVKKAIELFKKDGAKKVVLLQVSAPFHSIMMQNAALKLSNELNKIKIFNAKLPIVTNVTGKIINNYNEIKENLILQAASPVLWEDSINEIVKFGANIFIEVGPGRVLTGFNKKINKEITSLNVEDINSLEKFCNYYKEEH